MRVWIRLLIFPILATMACSFAARPTPTPQPPPPTATRPPVFIDARGTPEEDEATNTPAPTTSTTSNCVVRTDWQIYYVQSGDTLGSLAQRTGSTISALATANCLANPNALTVGQALRVPRTPSAVLPPIAFDPNSCPPTGNDNPAQPVSIAPYVRYEAKCYLLQNGATVTVSWPQAPPNFVEVTFYRSNEFMSRPDVIGVDTYNGDGAAISWVVNGQPAIVYAIALGPTNADSNIVGITTGS
jgi:LysM repeat protein